MVRLGLVWMNNHPPSVLWHCWLGHQTCKNRRPYNTYCVGTDVKPCSINAHRSILRGTNIECGENLVWPIYENLPTLYLISYLTFRPSYTHAWSMTTGKQWHQYTIMRHRSISRYHHQPHQVHHIHRVTYSHCINTATDTLSESRVWHCCQLVCSPKSSLRWSLKRTKSSITPSRSTGPAECATRTSSWFNRDWPVVCQLTQQHAERSLAFNTCDRAGQQDSCKHTNIFQFQ